MQPLNMDKVKYVYKNIFNLHYNLQLALNIK